MALRQEDIHAPTMVPFSRVTVRPDQMGGQPCIRGLRLPVATIVAMVADGMTHEEILAAFPGVEAEDIREALLYAAEAVREAGAVSSRCVTSEAIRAPCPRVAPDRIARALGRLRGQLPWLERAEAEVREDYLGELAVFVRLIVRSEIRDLFEDGERIMAARREVRAALDREAVDLWPYIELVSADEVGVAGAVEVAGEPQTLLEYLGDAAKPRPDDREAILQELRDDD